MAAAECDAVLGVGCHLCVRGPEACGGSCRCFLGEGDLEASRVRPAVAGASAGRPVPVSFFGRLLGIITVGCETDGTGWLAVVPAGARAFGLPGETHTQGGPDAGVAMEWRQPIASCWRG